MSGYVGDLSAPQEEALRQLKEAVSDVHQPHYDDHYYLRWLRAREFDVHKAEAMLRKNVLFRKQMGTDSILTDYEPHELLHKYYPRGYIGLDKEGCPVRVMPMKNLDLRGFIYSVKKLDILKFLTFLFEQDIKKMDEITKRAGKYIEQHSHIVDLEGYSFLQATNKETIRMLIDIMKMYEANYPERMKSTYFINVPPAFNFVMNMLKPFISEKTLKKFKVFVKDYQAALLNDIDADILPKYLGGNKTDPDGNPRCESEIHYGGLIPPEYYVMKTSFETLKEDENATLVKIPSKSYRLVEIEVKDPNTKLEWTFETETKDIAVGFYYKRSNNATEPLTELIPVHRVFCHLVPESGAFFCDMPGTYYLKFDNTYSWFTSKKVLYKVQTFGPEASEITI